ncbi:hypothetical protein EYC84_009803 [Monilinia fructicola]|uniref:Uncharacterized protein n=1 Tax=Monilinia fructicola TaxID=38448 RepID=A0A5M9JDV3_MONFR|nr:hypothetical protein EYC84_009803 [Monilinia fructicola]
MWKVNHGWKTSCFPIGTIFGSAHVLNEKHKASPKPELAIEKKNINNLEHGCDASTSTCPLLSVLDSNIEYRTLNIDIEMQYHVRASRDENQDEA